jgi:hypothetical protein
LPRSRTPVCATKVKKVLTDQYAAPAIVDYLQRRGLPVSVVNMSATSKTAIYGELRARLNMDSLGLYEMPNLLQELRRLRSRYTAGSANVVNPRVGGSHGDMAQALAMAVHGQHGVNADLHAAYVKEGRFDATPGSLAAMRREDERLGQPPLSRRMRL